MNKTSKKYIRITVVILIVGGGILLWSQGGDSAGTNPSSKNLHPEQSISHGHGLALDVQDPNRLYIATHHGLLVLVNEKDLYRIGKSKDDYMGFSSHPTEANVFFSSGHPSFGGNIGFQKSEDGGFTWRGISDGLDGPVDFHAMTVSPVNPNFVYGWYRGYLQRTTDGGTSWTKFETSVPLVQLAADIQDEAKLYASSPQGLFVSNDKGESWQKLFDGFVSVVAVHPTDARTLLSFSEKFRLAKSVDSGVTWQPIATIFDGDILFITFSRQNPDTIYALTHTNALYKSADGGNTWARIR